MKNTSLALLVLAAGLCGAPAGSAAGESPATVAADSRLCRITLPLCRYVTAPAKPRVSQSSRSLAIGTALRAPRFTARKSAA